MKTKLLKILRKRTWNKYEIRNWFSESDKPWRICDGPKTALAYHEYATKQEAIEVVKKMWHEEAIKYLWDHRNERRKNKYPY